MRGIAHAGAIPHIHSENRFREALIALLRAVAGPLKGALFQLVTQEVTIGRQSSNHLCIADKSVSRQHCVIRRTTEGFRIQNLSTINGTVINGKKVDEQILTHGDKIRIGDTIFHYAEDNRYASDTSLA